MDLSNTNMIMATGMEYLFEATHYDFPVIEYGRGSKVWDVDGNEYFDLNAGQFCLTFGHNYEPFIECINKQMKRIWHTNTATLTPEVFEAAKKMAEINANKLTKTMFLSTGSEANESALRYAKFITKRSGVVSISAGYHGLTLGSQSITFGGKWALPNISNAYSVTAPDYIHSEKNVSMEEYIDNCIAEAKELVFQKREELAAFIMEPIIGAGGMVEVPARYMKAIRNLCDEYGILLIFDECQCGFGRTGEWFSYQRAGVVPDIVTTAKAMGMGIAVSAVTFKDSIIKGVEGKVTNFSSHQNDPLSAAVVCFVIDEIRKKNLLKRNKEMGEYLMDAIRKICEKTEYLIDARGVGLMCGFDLNDSLIDDCKTFSNRFIKKMQENGILIQSTRNGKTFRLLPNYLITKAEIDYISNGIIKSILSM